MADRAARRRKAWALLAAIMLAAAVLRIVCAHGLYPTWDEKRHIELSRALTLRSDLFYLPLGSPGTNHPPGVLYVIALFNWAGGGNPWAIRLAFIAFAMFGLAGFFLLALRLLGWRWALIALALAAVDRHLAALAPVFLESPSVIFLAPWAILLMRNCLNRGRPHDWLLTGLVFGAGYWFSTVFLAMLLPFALYILWSGKLLRTLRSPWMYAGLAVLLLLMLPNIAWNSRHHGVNYDRNVSKVGSFGLSPRMALLYLGDLLICLKDPLWIIQNAGKKIYSPVYVPCHWAIGMAYLALSALAIRYWRDERAALLWAVMLGFLIPVTFIDAREPWNEFTWASSTVFAAILLSVLAIRRVMRARAGRIAGWVLVGCSGAATLTFLGGAKWGYFCPEWERWTVGRIMAAGYRLATFPPPAEEQRELDVAHDLIKEGITRDGGSAMAWYYLGMFLESNKLRGEAFRRSLEIQPDNPPVLLAQAQDWLDAGEPARAKQTAERLLALCPDSVEGCELMADALRRLGDYSAAIHYARLASRLAPDNYQAYKALFELYDAVGRRDDAEASLTLYVRKHRYGPASAYLSIADHYWQIGDRVRGAAYLQRALGAKPRLPEEYSRAGVMLRDLGDSDRAMRHFQAAADLGDRHPGVYYNLAQLWEEQGEFDQALRFYRHALQLDSNFAEAHYGLGCLLALLSRTDEANVHLQEARRLGFAPSAGDQENTDNSNDGRGM